MHRNQQIGRRPASSGVNQSSNIHYYTQPYGQPFLQVPQSNPVASQMEGLPLNQASTITYSSFPVAYQRSPPKPGSVLRPGPSTRKVYFTHYNPGTLQVERHFIETIVHTNNRPYASEWEQRYFELVKQITSFQQIHEKMTQEFLQMKEQIKHSNQASTLREAEEATGNNALRIESEIKQSQELQQKCQNLIKQLNESRQEANTFKDQNIKLQNVIVQYQGDIMEQHKVYVALEAEKNRIGDIVKQYEFKFKQIEINNDHGYEEKKKIKQENYEIKLLLAAKNKEIEDLTKALCKKPEVKPEVKTPQKKSINEKQFEERLIRVKNQYERKQKKYQRLIQQKVKQISDLRAFITEVQQRQRTTKQLKQRYQKLYNQKKQQTISLRNIQQTSQIQGENEHNAVYQQKIQELTKIAKQQNEKIKKLEDQRKRLQAKILQYEDNYVSQKQLQKLHHVIEQQKNQVLSVGGYNYDELNNKAEPYFNGKIFEQQLIYQLKKDNQKLLKFLHRANLAQQFGLPHLNYQSQAMQIPNSILKLGLLMKSKINDTFFKLCRIAQNITQAISPRNENLSSPHQTPGSSPSKTKRSRQSPKKQKKATGSEQNSTLSRVSDELKTLKVYMVDLNEVCQRVMQQLQRQQQTAKIISRQQSELIRTERQFNVIVPRDSELIEFHKCQNKKLEARIDELIHINSNLKQKLAGKHAQDRSGQEYWQLEVNRLRVELDELTVRYNKILASFQESQDRKQQFESKCALYSVEIERLNLLLRQYEQRIAHLNETVVKVQQARTRCQSLERQLHLQQHSSSQSNIRIQQLTRNLAHKQQQISALNSTISDWSRKYETLRSQNYQLTTKLQTQISSYNSLQGSVASFHTKLQAYTRSLESCQLQINTNKATIETWSRRYSELESKYQALKASKTGDISTGIDPYAWEMLRSILIEAQVLTRQLSVEESQRNKSILNVLWKKYTNVFNLMQNVNVANSNQSSKDSFSNQQKLKLEHTIRQLVGRAHANFYYTQIVRSILIQIQCLVNQLPIQAGSGENTLRAVRTSIEKGLQNIGRVDILQDY